MAYIGLIPEELSFPSEHLTLVWVGHSTVHDADVAKKICHLFNIYNTLSREEPEHGERPSFTVHAELDRPYRNFGGTVVAAGEVNDPVRTFRRLATMVQLNNSAFGWTPHITGEQKQWREPGEVVLFRHAEWRD